MPRSGYSRSAESSSSVEYAGLRASQSDSRRGFGVRSETCFDRAQASRGSTIAPEAAFPEFLTSQSGALHRNSEGYRSIAWW